jgi:benzylsuccinate CoA-transferase BbsF subunit
MENNPPPLKGIRIADFCWVFAGPYCNMLLSCLGAEVIKVEGHRRTDLLRHGVIWPLADPAPTPVPPNEGMAYNSLNMNKKSLTLDLSKPEGVAVAKKLVAVSDVVVDNMRAGSMARMGMAYADLRRIKSDIIVLSLSSRGQEGPQKDYAGYASIHHAIGGGAYVTGYPDDAPCHNLGDVDLMNSNTAAFAIVTALYHREQTGEGQFIDCSQVEGVTSLIGELMLGYEMNGRVPERMGNAHPYFAPHNVYKCWGVDRWLALEVHSDEEFAILAQVINQPELAKDARFADMASRKKNEAALDRIIEDWTKERDRDWLSNEFCRAGLAAAPSRNGEDIYADPHLRARETFVTVDHPDWGDLELMGSPWKMSGDEAQIQRAPLLGEHNDEVLKGLLGLSEAEVNNLRQKDIIL